MMLYILAIVGFFLSAYLLVVKLRLGREGYVPLCDLSETFTCSGVVRSPHGALFGVPNATLGLLFYVLVAVFYAFSWSLALFVLSFAGVVASVFLASLLVRMRKVCVVCVLSYVVNVFLFVLVSGHL